MPKWIREDGFVFHTKKAIDSTIKTWMSTQLTPEEIEEWFELQREAIEAELDALEEDESGTTGNGIQAESESDPNATGNGSNSEPITRPKNNTERIKLGRPCEYSPCSCGHRGVNIPLSSHSDWCDFKLWRESLYKGIS